MENEKESSFEYLVKHFPDYPCGKCKRKDADNCARAITNVRKHRDKQVCDEYKEWFFKTWKELGKQFRKV